ncbi:Uncharacterised protein [Shigella flexneri]|nr:Uncharacterised protein [Shigella flexneri]
MQRASGRKRGVSANKVSDRHRRLIHQVIGDLAVFQVGIKRIILQSRHHLFDHIHLSIIPGLLDLRVTATLLIQ